MNISADDSKVCVAPGGAGVPVTGLCRMRSSQQVEGAISFWLYLVKTPVKIVADIINVSLRQGNVTVVLYPYFKRPKRTGLVKM